MSEDNVCTGNMSDYPEEKKEVGPESRQTPPLDEDEENLVGIGENDDGKSGRATLSVLLQDNFLQEGKGVMSFDYLGQTFKGDLLSVGKIRCQETGLVFNNPSAWAMYCKKIINPAKKSGSGWASVKFKGRKMDCLKNAWLKMKAARDRSDEVNIAESVNSLLDENSKILRIVMHNQLALKSSLDDMSTMVIPESFATIGKIQPFIVTISSSALLVVDLQCHMSQRSVCGYLAGQWDANLQHMAITDAYPCLVAPDISFAGARDIENAIFRFIHSKRISLVGWYRSTPHSPALPSLSDCENQLEYEIKMLGPTEGSPYTPCLGLLCSPIFVNGGASSVINGFWVMPPPEVHIPTSQQSNSFTPAAIQIEYGKPMQVEYSVVTDVYLSQVLIDQLDSIIDFYRLLPSKFGISFRDRIKNSNRNTALTLLSTLRRSLISKFPRDVCDDEMLFWTYLRVRILGHDLNNSLNSVEPLDDLEEEEIDDDEENALNDSKSKKKDSNNTFDMLPKTPLPLSSKIMSSTLDFPTAVPLPLSQLGGPTFGSQN